MIIRLYSKPPAVMKKFREWRKKKPKQAYFLANLTESAMDVPQLASGQLQKFQAEIFEGIPESSPPGAPRVARRASTTTPASPLRPRAGLHPSSIRGAGAR